MDTFRIICPNCGLSRNLPKDRLPPKPVRATCPGCKNVFSLDPATLSAVPDAESISLPPAPEPRRSPLEPPPPPPRTQPRPEPGPAQGRVEMQGIGELMGAAWAAFQARFGTLFCVYLLFMLLMVGLPFLGGGIGILLSLALPSMKNAIMATFVALGGVAGLAGASWGCGALFAAALDDSLDVRGAFEAAKPKILPLLWVSLLMGFIVTGGFLLFLVPGIIFAVWFFMAPLIVIDDDTRGMSAILKSRALVSGRWFDVFLRLLVMWVCSALVGAIPVVGPLLVIVATPYLVLYQALLFKDLQRVAEPVVFGCSFWDKARWPLLALVAYVALPLVLLGFFGMSFLGQMKPVLSGGTGSIIKMQPGSLSSPDGDWKVIPIPTGEAQQETPESESSTTPSASPSFPLDEAGQEGAPENIHVFIYVVNCGGRVLANGEELKELGTKPDMQYNYNMFGDKLRYGQNTITVEYSPLEVSGNMLDPQVHIKISRSSEGERQVLGEWKISEKTSGRQDFDLHIPHT